MLRKAIGGTWLKVKSVDDKREYWVKPSNPEATQFLKRDKILETECHGTCLFRSQDMTTIF